MVFDYCGSSANLSISVWSGWVMEYRHVVFHWKDQHNVFNSSIVSLAFILSSSPVWLTIYGRVASGSLFVVNAVVRRPFEADLFGQQSNRSNRYPSSSVTHLADSASPSRPLSFVSDHSRDSRHDRNQDSYISRPCQNPLPHPMPSAYIATLGKFIPLPHPMLPSRSTSLARPPSFASTSGTPANPNLNAVGYPFSPHCKLKLTRSDPLLDSAWRAVHPINPFSWRGAGSPVHYHFPQKNGAGRIFTMPLTDSGAATSFGSCCGTGSACTNFHPRRRSSQSCQSSSAPITRLGSVSEVGPWDELSDSVGSSITGPWSGSQRSASKKPTSECQSVTAGAAESSTTLSELGYPCASPAIDEIGSFLPSTLQPKVAVEIGEMSSQIARATN